MKFICKKCGSTDYKIIEKSNGNGIATGLYCAKCGQWQKWLNKQEKVLFANDINSTAEVDVLKRDVENLTRTLEEVNEEYRALQAENAELRARLDKAIELPAIVMIERALVDGKFKPTQKAQAFNGRIGVVYRDEKRWNGLLVDICSEKVYDYDAANARLAELKGEKQ